MKLIKPHFEILEQQPSIDGIYKMTEYAGRICYKSSDKITEDSAKPFIDNILLKRGHYSPLEHGTVYLKIPTGLMAEVDQTYHKYLFNPYSKAICRYVPLDGYIYVTTNYRVLIENGWLDDLKYLCEPTEFHEKRTTVKFILSRSIAQEYTRHRVFSYSMESQRYCNYSKNRFNNEITFILPPWVSELQLGQHDPNKIIEECKGFEIWSNPSEYSELLFILSLALSEKGYFNLLNCGWKPQQAREVLPNACKTELVMTGFVSDWKHFFELRCASNAHPQAQELAIPLRQEFISRGYINE